MTKRGVLLVDEFLHAVQQCTLNLTTKAKDALQKHFHSAHLLFDTQKEMLTYVEKRTSTTPGETNIALFIDARENEAISELLNGQIAVINGVLRNTGFLATNFYVAEQRFPLHTTRRLHARIHFNTHTTNAAMPIPFYKAMRQLPNADEQQETIKKRIASWEGYLHIQEQNASIDDIEATYANYTCNNDFTRMTLTVRGLTKKQWHALQGLSASIVGFDALGDVVRVNERHETIELELQARVTEQLRKQRQPKQSGAISFSNFATLSQIRRLRRGFQDLAKGYAANPNLEDILFEEVPQIEPPTQLVDVTFQNNLNEFQQAAVIGAMSANDLYCIQGPPGTGKTTVISEICYQNAKAGLKTLVASQSNLAVDNALSRLLKHKDIRILRYGRTESIEEEGKKFIEENIGHYWLDTTKAEMERHRYNEAHEREQLVAKKDAVVAAIAAQNDTIAQLHEQISEKAAAKIALRSFNQKMMPLHAQLDALAVPRKVLEQEVTKLSNSYNKVFHQRIELERYIENSLDGTTLTAQIQELKAAIQLTQAKRTYILEQQRLHELQQQLTAQKEQVEHASVKQQQLTQLLQALEACSSARALAAQLAGQTLTLSAFSENQLTQALQLEYAFVQFSRLKEVNTRLMNAMHFLEQKLGSAAQSVLPVWVGRLSIEQIDALLSDIRTALLAEGRVMLETLSTHLAKLKGAKQALNEQGHALKQQAERYNSIWRGAYATVANEATTQLRFIDNKLQQLRTELQAFHDNVAAQQSVVTALLEKVELPIEENANTLARLTNDYVNRYSMLQTNYDTVKQKQAELAVLLDEEKPLKAAHDAKRALLDENLQQEMALLEELEVIENERAHFKALAESNPEALLQDAQQALQQQQALLTTLEQQLNELPKKQALQAKWREMLQQATDYDVDEIKKLYVKHANVIGTTCVQSARKDFIDTYPQFDVVIIDEVSKATPPELLLPMLKGKKIILVGDHHQLPPLLGDDTLEETLEAVVKQSTQFAQKDELEQLLRESLFERLFKALPATNKQMLAIQYRMHEKIMAGITPFYAHEQGGLRCGLPNSDEVRDHLLDGRFMQRSDHLLWIDLPNKAPYFEQRVKGGSSLFNEGELQTIRALLLDINDATARAKEHGLLPHDAKKSVGIISFYGEQVKKITRLVQQELQLPHLHMRTGTVDKFQGMEMDVMLVSMVRNTPEAQGHIGFARDYRRLNVAVSRARELCVMIGSVQMFTQKERSEKARSMYKTLYTTIEQQQGIRTLEEVM